MAQAAIRSRGKKTRKKSTKSDGFLLYVPLCASGNIELPVLNTFSNCVCFTTRWRLDRWKDHYQIDVVRVKKYEGVGRMPKMIQIMMLGRRPKGLALDPNPITANQYDLAFISKANDFALTDDVELIAAFVKRTAEETKDSDPEIK